MAEVTNVRKRLQWHGAFFAGIQIELEEDADKLIFENEHQLSTKPLGIDVLIIKKQKDEQIRKNIGRIFRGHNLIEYKSPDDNLCIDDFYKVIAYAGLYKADVKKVDSIKADDLTISFVSKSYPRKMVGHIETVQKLKIKKYAKGIYYIVGGIFPMQVIITSELSKEDNFWLKNLTNNLRKKEDAEEIFREYGKYPNSNLHKSVMDIIVRANEGIFKEASENMCDAIMELMQDVIQDKLEESRKLGMSMGMEEGRLEGRLEGLLEGRLEGRLEALLDQIRKKIAKGKSVEQIADELEETVENIQTLITKIDILPSE